MSRRLAALPFVCLALACSAKPPSGGDGGPPDDTLPPAPDLELVERESTDDGESLDADGGSDEAGPTEADPTGTDPTEADPTEPDPTEPVPTEPVPTEPAEAKAKVERGKISLSPFKTTLTVAKGSTLSFSFESHPSVGYDAEYGIGNPRILGHLRTDMVYAHPKKMKAGMTGADEATGTFVWEALAPGKTTLTVTTLFRGSTERELVYTITVVDG